MSRDQLASQIDTLIDKVVLPMEENQIEYISTDAVAREVVALIDPETLSPELMKYASVLHVKQCVRRRLGKRHDPVKRAEEYVDESTDDLFGDTLQPYYPVNREGEKRYARRDILSEVDVEIIYGRMKRAGKSLIEHADSLKAWFYSKQA